MAVEVQATLLIEDTSILRVLNIDDLTALPDDAATETTLSAILAALGGASVTAYNATGSVTNGAGDDGIVASIVAPADYSLRGIAVTGEGDGVFTISVGAVLVATARIKFHQPSVVIAFPTAIPVTPGVVVHVDVVNESLGLTRYDTTIFGEVAV
jgi:hypothetical protein